MSLATSAEAADPRPRLTGAPGRGATLDAGEPFSLTLRTRLQIRGQYAAPADTSFVGISTARMYVSGHAYTRKLRYVVQLAVAARDHRDGATSPVYDAFFDWQLHSELGLKVGQYFVPFDRLRTVRELALEMPDRPSAVGELTLDRDTGVTLHSRGPFGSALGFHLGAFGGRGTNTLAPSAAGGMLVGRLEVRPLGPIDDDSEGDLERRTVPGLAIGFGAASNRNTTRVRSTSGPAFEGGTADYRHVAADLVFKWRGLSVETEYVRRTASSDAVVSFDGAGAPRIEPTRSGHGWVVQASYTFDPPVQVVGRLGRLMGLHRSDPRLVSEVEARGEELGAGLNYYVGGHALKIQAAWIARMPWGAPLDRADHLAQVQLDATL